MVQCRFHALYLVGKYVYAQRPVPHDGSFFRGRHIPKLGHRKNANSTMGVRIGVLCSILVSYIICYTLSAGVIARGTALFMGICAATFLPAYFCSLFWKKRPRKEHWLVYGRGHWQVCLPCCFFTRRKPEQSAYAICCLGVMFWSISIPGSPSIRSCSHCLYPPLRWFSQA